MDTGRGSRDILRIFDTAGLQGTVQVIDVCFEHFSFVVRFPLIIYNFCYIRSFHVIICNSLMPLYSYTIHANRPVWICWLELKMTLTSTRIKKKYLLLYLSSLKTSDHYGFGITVLTDFFLFSSLLFFSSLTFIVVVCYLDMCDSNCKYAYKK